MPTLILSNPLGADDAQRIGLEIRPYAVGEQINVNDFVLATMIRTGYGLPFGTFEDVLLIGQGPPNAGVGVDGQWYLDTLDEVLWGPKTDDVWPSDPIRPDRGVQQLRVDVVGDERHLIVVYSSGTEIDLGDIRGPAGPEAPLASPTTPGRIQLAGDLAGTPEAPTVPRLDELDAALDGKAAATDVIPLTQKGAAGGVATLDPGGLIPSAQLPPLAITNTFPVSSQAEQLALVAERGDVAIRADGAGTFILRAEPASVLANWSQLSAPAGGVTSVNGRTGVVDLSDLYLALTARGAANGVASLDGNGKVPAAQLPAAAPPPAASETVAGVIEIATSTETTDGVDALRAVTPAGLAAVLGKYARDRGSGASLPTTDLRRGDVYQHTGLNCLMVRTDNGWRQVDIALVSAAAARTALSTNNAADLHVGFQARQTDTGVTWEWTGSTWVADLTPWAVLPLVGGTGLGHDPAAGMPQCMYRKEGGRGGLRGWAYTSGGVAANGVVVAAGGLPVELRPPVAATIWPVKGAGVTRFDVQPTGAITSVDAQAAGVYVNLNAVTWPLS